MLTAPDPLLRRQARQVAEALAGVEGGLLLVVTGAGVSLASGLATFRGSDPGAIWKRDVLELATLGYFRHDPVGSWRWYLSRFETVLHARPNPAHLALAALERWQTDRGNNFLLVTQNIDLLHEQAGSRAMVKVHGTADRLRCERDGCSLGSPAGSLLRAEVDLAPFLAAPGRDTLPRCPECGALLRQHVLWFDELYASHLDYQWEQVMQALDRMHLALCIGTSFSVGLTESLLQTAFWNRVPVLSVDPGEATVVASRGLEQVRARSEELLPLVCEELGLEPVRG